MRRDRDLNSDPGAALGAASVDDRAATGRLHADTKTVGLFAAGNGRLVGTFHDELDQVYNRTANSPQNFALSCFINHLVKLRTILFYRSPRAAHRFATP